MQARRSSVSSSTWFVAEHGEGIDGHIVPLNDDSGIQELLDAHPEFHSRAERRLAEQLAELKQCPENLAQIGPFAMRLTEASAVDCSKVPFEKLVRRWLAWAAEEGE